MTGHLCFLQPEPKAVWIEPTPRRIHAQRYPPCGSLFTSCGLLWSAGGDGVGGDGLPLVDILSSGEDISTGKQEIELLAEHLAIALVDPDEDAS